MRLKYRILFTLLVLLAAVPVAAVMVRRSGVRVVLVKRGPHPLSNVVVHVTGNAHPVGRLGVGETRTVRVRPTSESHVELEFLDGSGTPQRIDAGGYFEPGYRGVIQIELGAGRIRRFDDRTRVSLY